MVIPWADVSEEEGTGLVHIAPGCGKEDFALGKQFGLTVIAPLDQFGLYGEGFGWLTGRDVHEVADDLVADLQEKVFCTMLTSTLTDTPPAGDVARN
jgi:isoleucyl-tRNA synthetase